MKQVILLAMALCLFNVACKKEKQSDYYKAKVLQGGNYCGKGTWVKLEQAIPTPSAGSSNILNVMNLPDAYNVPGKTIEFSFKFDQTVRVCDAYHDYYPNVNVSDLQ